MPGKEERALTTQSARDNHGVRRTRYRRGITSNATKNQ